MANHGLHSSGLVIGREATSPKGQSRRQIGSEPLARLLLEQTLADYGKQVEDRGEEYNLRNFFDRLNAIDSIPISLARWELTGLDDMVPSQPESDR